MMVSEFLQKTSHLYLYQDPSLIDKYSLLYFSLFALFRLWYLNHHTMLNFFHAYVYMRDYFNILKVIFGNFLYSWELWAAGICW